ncbi:MAG: hypothetical protein Tsb005_10230 [Gammaproteobacteria bacterium]
MYKLIRMFLVLWGALWISVSHASDLHIGYNEAITIGGKIWRNEGGSRIHNLIAWNNGEEFASLGIGHFIWYPKNYHGPFEEVFPKFLAYAKQQGAHLPEWLRDEHKWYCPWDTKAEFEQAQHSVAMVSLRNFLLDSIPLQVQFIAQRLEHALPKILSHAPQVERARLREIFYLLASTPQGRYALMDYINFKGEGILESERYHGQGWGMLQVLEQLQQEKNLNQANVVAKFSDAAAYLLTQRVKNSPPERGEKRWLVGWKNRLHTYKQA